MDSSTTEFKNRVNNMVLVPKSLYEKCLNHMDNEVKDLASSVNIRQLNNFCKADQPDNQKWGLPRSDVLKKINIKYVDKEGDRQNRGAQKGSYGEVNIENVGMPGKKSFKSNAETEQNRGGNAKSDTSNNEQNKLQVSEQQSQSTEESYPTLFQNQKKKYLSDVRPKLQSDLNSKETFVEENKQPSPTVVAVNDEPKVDNDDNLQNEPRINVQNEQESVVDQGVNSEKSINDNIVSKVANEEQEPQVYLEGSSEKIINGIIPKLTKSQFSNLKWHNAPPTTQSYTQIKRLADRQVRGLQSNENTFQAQLRNRLRRKIDKLKQTEKTINKENKSNTDDNDLTDLLPTEKPIKENNSNTVADNDLTDLSPTLSSKILTKETVQQEQVSPTDLETEIDMLDNQKLDSLDEFVGNKKEDIERYEHLLHDLKRKQFKKKLDSTGQWRKRRITKKLKQARIDYMKLLDIYNDILDEKINDQERKRQKLQDRGNKLKVEVTDDNVVPIIQEKKVEKMEKMIKKKKKVKVINDKEIPEIVDLEKDKTVRQKKSRKRKLADSQNERQNGIENKKAKRHNNLDAIPDHEIPLIKQSKGRKRKPSDSKMENEKDVKRKKVEGNKLKVKTVDDNKVDIMTDIVQKKGIKRKTGDLISPQSSEKKSRKGPKSNKRKAVDEIESNKKKKKRNAV